MTVGLDHLVYAAPSLELGVDEIERLLGVRAAFGGKHTGRGTYNALLSLGADCYIEIIAPDPEQRNVTAPLPFGLDGLAGPRLVTWAAKAGEIDARVKAARATGYDPGPIISMHRDGPDGTRLSWRIALLPQLAGDGLVPFLIEWDPGPHPASTSPAGCTFLSLRAEHPDPGSIDRMLEALEVDMAASRGPAPRLIATIRGRHGTVEIS